jgi:hypothetical protein
MGTTTSSDVCSTSAFETRAASNRIGAMVLGQAVICCLLRSMGKKSVNEFNYRRRDMKRKNWLLKKLIVDSFPLANFEAIVLSQDVLPVLQVLHQDRKVADIHYS